MKDQRAAVRLHFDPYYFIKKTDFINYFDTADLKNKNFNENI